MNNNLEEKTINIVVQNRIKKYGDRAFSHYKKDGKWHSICWNEFGKLIKFFSLGLISYGMQKKDTVCLLAKNRWEWPVCDFAILAGAGITVPIYPTLVAKDVAYITSHCEAKILIVENQEQLDKVLSVKSSIPNINKIIVIEDDYKQKDEADIISFQNVLKQGEEYSKSNPTVFEERLLSCEPEDIATLVYTSGTTGPPKGSIITHSNIMFVCRTVKKIWHMIDDKESHLSFLPLAHVYERMGAQFFGLYNGGQVYYAQSYDTIGEDAKEAKPTLFLGVPRVYEKIYARIQQTVESSPRLRKKIFNWAVNVGKEYIKLDEQKKRIPISLLIKYRIADKIVYSKLRNAIGGKVKYLLSSAAPLAKEIQEFFNACGFRLFEGWGMTETTGPSTLNTPECFKIGTVGKPLPGVEIKIADDGEILVKGGNVFSGYYKQPAETQETLIDGWIHTGDIGVLDSDGFLKITDRKKDIIITAGGKNIAPQNIENLLKTDKRIAEAVVIGDKRPYLTALIILDRIEVEKFAKENNLKYKNYEELINSEEVKNFVKKIIDEKNKELAQFETIKKFTILPQEFSIETGELTPTLKVKRKVVNEKYKKEIEKMYE